ncbi:hypothetical protein [Asticcacaulis solisilvae]|uniref:hypothetical protein n=1 Tax=Asticcacaulis solisilvae TaxID=1217274 RepID=UPI003FD82017
MDEKKIDYFLKMSAAFVAVSFAISYAYRLAFLLRLGIFFGDVPISLIDISKGTLAIMPLTALYGGVSIGLNFYLPVWHDNQLKTSTTPRQDVRPRFDERGRVRVLKILAIVVASVGAIYFTFYSSVIVLLGQLIMAGSSYVLGRYRHITGSFRLSSYLVVPIALGAALLAGDNRAWTLISSQNQSSIVLTSGKMLPTTILDTYEAGILIATDGQPKFLKWDQVAEIRYKKFTAFPSILCSLDDQFNEISIPVCAARH